MTTLIPAKETTRLLENGRQQVADPDGRADPVPVTKLFTPDSQATWLLSELDPDEPDRAFGLCDLGLGCPELGWVSLSEIGAQRGPLGLPIERDRHFHPTEAISVYAERARQAGRIVA